MTMLAHTPLSALVIATATGEPMRSERPKPIHLLCGRPMLRYVLDALGDAGADKVNVVTGPFGDWVSKRVLEDPPSVQLNFVEQRHDRGSADAALLGLNSFDDFDDDGELIVMPADLPLLRTETLQELIATHRATGAACTVLTARSDRAGAVGHDHIVRDSRDRVSAVVTAESGGADMDGADLGSGDVDRADVGSLDAGAEPSTSDDDVELSYGVYVVRRGLLAPALRRTRPHHQDGRHRFSDLVKVLAESGHPVETAPVLANPEDARPVDNRRLLADAEAELRHRTNLRWLDRGVTMIDPSRTYIDATVELGIDVTLFPGTMLQGSTVIGDGCEIGPDTRLDRCTVGRDAVIEKTMARLAVVGDNCRVGPFAVLEPGSDVADGETTGPFYASRARE